MLGYVLTFLTSGHYDKIVRRTAGHNQRCAQCWNQCVFWRYIRSRRIGCRSSRFDMGGRKVRLINLESEYPILHRAQHARAPRIFPCQCPCTYPRYTPGRKRCKSTLYGPNLVMADRKFPDCPVPHPDPHDCHCPHRYAFHNHKTRGRTEYFGRVGTGHVFHGGCECLIYR